MNQKEPTTCKTFMMISNCKNPFGLHSLNKIHELINPYPAKGSCQVKTNPKIREKLGLVRPHPPTPFSNFSFFLKHFKT